jgi:hypothetical protein
MMSELSSEAPLGIAVVSIVALPEQAPVSRVAVEAAFPQRGSRPRGVLPELAELARSIARLGQSEHRLSAGRSRAGRHDFERRQGRECWNGC